MPQLLGLGASTGQIACYLQRTVWNALDSSSIGESPGKSSSRMPTRRAFGSRARPTGRARMRRGAGGLPDRRLQEASSPGMAGTLARDDFAPHSRDGKIRRAQRGARILRCPQAEMEHEDERRPEGPFGLLPPAIREADDSRAKGVEVPKSIRDRIARECEWILKKALRHCDGLPECDPARKGKRGRKKRRPGHDPALRSWNRMEEALLFPHDLSVPSRTTWRSARSE